MIRQSNKKKWTELTTEELAAATRQYDQEMPDLPGKSLSVRERARFDRWQRNSMAQERARRGRPRIGKGAQRVTIAMERGLLKEADAYARQHRLNRSELIAIGLRQVLAKAG